MKRIAVTGASGFIGRHLLEGLAARGDDAVPVARPYDRPRVTRLFEGLDAVVHLAGVVSANREEEYYRGNVEATRIIAESARDAGTRLVHISSLAAAGPAPSIDPRTERDPVSPVNAYGRSKLEGERVIEALSGLQWTILRPGVVYGPRDRALRPLFRYAKRGLIPVVGAAGAAYTFIYVTDVVRAILAAVDRSDTGDVIFLGHALPVFPVDLMETIRLVAGSHAPIVRIPRPLTRLAAEIGEWTGAITGRPGIINRRRYAELYSEGFVCRVDRMRERLGVTAETDLKEGLNRAASWYVEGRWPTR